MQTHPNAHLQDPNFWLQVEADELLPAIQELEAIAERTKVQNKKLNTLRGLLDRAKEDAIKLAALNAKWQKGEEGGTAIVGVPVSDPWIMEMFKDSPPPPAPLVDYCAFCGNAVDKINATKFTGKMKVRVELEDHKRGDDIVTTEKVKVVAAKLVSCKGCVLQIPKDGRINTSSTV